MTDYNRGTWQEALQDLGHEVELRKAAEAERDRLTRGHEILNAALAASTDDVIKLQERLARVVEGSKKMRAQLELAKAWLEADLKLDSAIERELSDRDYMKDAALYGSVDVAREAFRKAIEDSNVR